jgi:TP901 family phage tail tape measure protein
MAGTPDITLFADVQLNPDVESKLQQRMSRISNNIRINLPLGSISRDFQQFDRSLASANQRVIAFGTSLSILGSYIKTFRDIVTSTVEVEKALKDINSVFGLTTSGLDKFSRGLFNVARETAQSFQVTAEAAKEFSRQGLTAQETLKRTRDALILTRLATLDATQAVETLTASVNGFHKSGLDTTQIINKLATVDAAFAVSAKDLAEGLARAGAAASDAGVSFDELLGLITAAQQTTARGGAVIGNSLKTIFTRVERRSTIEALEALGVQVRDLEGNTLRAIPLLQNFAKVYDQLGGSIKKQAAELVGGVFQINILKAVLGDLARQQNIFTDATNKSRGATDEAILRNEALNKSLQSVFEQFAVTNKQIFANIGNQTFAEPLKGITRLLVNNPITDAMKDATGQAETIGGEIAQGIMRGLGNTLMFTAGPILIKALAKITSATLRTAVLDVGQLAGIFDKSIKNKQIQQEIVQLYNAGGEGLRYQLATMSSLAAKAELLQRYLEKAALSNRTLQNETAIMAGIMNRRGYTPPRRPGGAAVGYIPHAAGGGFGDALRAESQAISRGVGGASRSARPVVLHNFAFGAGQRGPLVANTDEFVVPHFAGGGSAVFNQEMIQKYGLPPGAKPVAAGGYVPNAASGGSSADLLFQYPFMRYGGREEFIKSVDIGSLNLDVSTRRQREKIAGLVREMLDVNTSSLKGPAKTAYQRLVRDVITIRQPEIEAITAQQVAARNAMASGMGYNWRMAEYRKGENLVYNENFQSGPTLAERMAVTGDVRTATEANALRLERRPRPPAPPAPRPSIFSRFTNRNWGRYAWPAAFAAPFIGGFLPEGSAGTGGGMALGGLSGALTGAGMGATIGSLIPGIGTGVGAIIGGASGGVIGAFNKLSKSAEELARDIDDAKKALSLQNERANEVLRLQSEIQDAIKSGATPAQLARLRARQDEAFSGLASGSVRTMLLNNLGNENVASMVLGAFSEDAERQDRISGFKFGVSKTGGLFKNLFGGASKDDISALSSGLVGGVSGMSAADRRSLEGLARNDPVAAIRILSKRLGLSEEDQKAVTADFDRLAGASGGFDKLAKFGDANISLGANPLLKRAVKNQLNAFTEGILQALAATDVGPLQKASEDAAGKALKESEQLEIQTEQLNSLIVKYKTQARRGSLMAAADLQIAQARQQYTLGDTSLTEFDRAVMSGNYALQNRQSEMAAQRAKELNDSRAGLLAIAKQKIITPAGLARLEGLNSRADVDALYRELSTTAGKNRYTNLGTDEVLKALEELSERIQTLDETEEANTRALEAVNERMIAALMRARSFAGGIADDTGAFRNASDRYTGSLARNDDYLTQLQGRVEMNIADANLRRRAGVLTDVEAAAIGLRETTGLDYQRRLQAYQARQGSRGFLISQGVSDADLAFDEDRLATQIALQVAQRRGDEEGSINGLLERVRTQRLESRFRLGLDDEGAFRLGRLQTRRGILNGSRFATSADLEDINVAIAREQGLQGDSYGSFKSGLGARFDALKRDFADFSEIGLRVAQSLESSLGNAFGDFITGARKGKDAFRDFAVSVLNDASRAMASKAMQQMLSMAFQSFGFGFPTTGATGGAMRFAAGGRVPSLLMGGEYVFGPQAARSIGYDTLRGLNRYASGGAVVKGGSGIRDDRPAMLPEGSFVLRKSAVNRLGVNYLNALANGGVLRRAAGGGISWTNVNYGSSVTSTPVTTNAINAQGATGGAGASAAGGMSWGGVGASIAAAVALAVISRLLQKDEDSYHFRSEGETIEYAKDLIRKQQSEIDSRPAGTHVYRNADGSYSTGQEADVRRFSNGGAVLDSAPVMSPLPIASDKPAIGGISITINNDNGKMSSETKMDDVMSGPNSEKFARTFAKMVDQRVQEAFIEAQRVGGAFRQHGFAGR